ncbi:MAG: hypothetical protein GY715_17510 [Planctomycetes bacterium]|nr:hypothetical protein [Planctomycetota bacterium]
MGFLSRARGREDAEAGSCAVEETAAKERLIGEIMELNPSAGRTWLDGFREPSLQRYLHHLKHAQEPRGRKSVWFREAETHAIVTRRKAA